MDQTITIHVPDSLHRALSEQGARLGKSVEQMAQDALLERFGNQPREDPMLSVLRAQGLLAGPFTPAQPSSSPMYGSPEQAALHDALGAEASDALNQTGKSLADVVER